MQLERANTQGDCARVGAARALLLGMRAFLFALPACNPGATNAGDASAGASGGASSDSAPDPDLPVVLYDRDDDEPSHDFGDSRPTVLTHFGSMLYWVELAEQESRIMQAPKDGSAVPRKLGTRSGYDIAKFSASERYVFWQDNGTLVAYDLKRDERRDIAQLIDDGYGGPSLAVGQGWAAFAASSCRSVATVNLKTWEVTQVKIHSEFRGGGTGLAHIGSNVYCANGPEIMRVELGKGSSQIIWSTENQVAQDEYERGLNDIAATVDDKLIFMLSRKVKARSVAWTSVQLLHPSSPAEEMLQEFSGINFVQFSPDPSARIVFYTKPGFSPVHFLSLDDESKSVGVLPGFAQNSGPLIVDEQYIYWAETPILSDRPNAKNAIYRQRKPQ